MVTIQRQTKVEAASTKEVSVLEAFISDMLKTMEPKSEPVLSGSPVYFRDLKGKEHNFQGINYLEAVVQSPLVEEGSGQLLCHPENTRNFAVRTTVRTSIPGNRLGVEGIRDKIRIAGAPLEGRWKNRTVAYGQAVISMAYPKADGKGISKKPIEKWGELMPGIVKEVKFHWEEETQLATVSVEMLMVMSGDNEKYRGFGKARGNGGFLRNITITQSGTGKLVFDPNQPLKSEGRHVQVEHVVGAEEYKVLNYIIGMIAHELDKVVWNSLTGLWEGYSSDGSKLSEDDLKKIIANKAKKVDVTRKWLDDRVYQMLKDLYGPKGKWYVKGEFSFDDSTNSVTHFGAPTWIGVQTQIIEVPLTLSFMGKTSMFAEHISYLGTEYPSLFGELMNSVERNSSHLEDLFDMATGVIPGANEDNPTGDALTFDAASRIIEGEKWALKKLTNEVGGTVVEELVIPPGCEFDTHFARTLGKKLKRLGFPGIVFEAYSSGDDIGVVSLSLEGFVGMTGDVAHKAFRTFSLLLQSMEVPEDDRDHEWDAEYYRLVRMLQGAMEFLLADSNALLAKVSKTEKCLLTARRLGTLDGSVKWDEAHAHPAFLQMFGIQPHYSVRLKDDGSRQTFDHEGECFGDWGIHGRVPVPGSSTQKWVANPLVPFGVVCQNAALVHYQDNGDHDGDSGVTIVLDFQGNLKPIKAGLNVNPIA